MALPASDNFNRADSNPISGGNWTGITNNHQIVTNAVQGTAFAYNLTYWSGDVFANDQYAQAAILNVSDGGPGVRISAGNNCYNFNANAGNNSRMQKVVAGAFTNLQSGLTTPAVNDVIYCEAVGTTIKLKTNGVQLGTNQTDSALASGSAGFFNYDTGGRYDNFLADNVGGAAATWGRLLGLANNRLVGAP